VDEERGAPVPGVMLTLDGESKVAIVSGDNRHHKSGADGRFHLDGVLPGQWTLTATSPDPGFVSTQVSIEVRDGGGTTDVGAIRLPRRPPQGPE
jgi:hypothetical protein